jgi:ABC-type Zn2+ transport system substrate-binding protein/surface adhesin
MGYFKKIDFNMKGSGLLHNKALLYFIFAISFGNFMIELINGDSYFVVIYILIGVLTTFFSKNMIVILAVATIFANILKYGKGSVEGFEEGIKDDDDDDKKDDDKKDDDDDDNNDKKGKENMDNSTDSSNNSTTTIDNFSDRELDNMHYKESEKMLENQKLLLQNMKEFKPFMDTIQNLAKSFVPPTVQD